MKGQQLKYYQPFMPADTPKILIFPEFPFSVALATVEEGGGVNTNTHRIASRNDHDVPRTSSISHR